jgi:asparagine synthase (glutamine-hydrolysing)
MCGIWTYISKNKKNYYDYFTKISHRGPDASSYMTLKDVNIGFHRLSIINKKFNGMQPFFDNNMVFLCNGEIYNYKILMEKYNIVNCVNDCMCIFELYKKLDFNNFLNVMNKEVIGEFAFIILIFTDNNNDNNNNNGNDNDNELSKIIVSRDIFGVRPLYFSKNEKNEYIFSSELKGIPKDFKDVKEFPCGSIVSIDYINNIEKCYDITNEIYQTKENSNYDLIKIKETLIEAVKIRLMADNPDDIGFYLSGGLDSSILCSIASKLIYPKKIKTFSIGFTGSTDLPYAKKVAKFINSEHKEIIITEEEALEAIDDVIYATCTYDITTIRASCGQYLLSKYIKEHTNIRIIINGDGSDEVLGGYIFNYYAPDKNKFHSSCLKYSQEIHMYDGRRLDRCLAYFGLEARVPFLDVNYVKTIWSIPSNMRMPSYNNCEKFLLRQVFNDETYLPQDCLFRKKEAFSDGISSKDKSWFSIINSKMNSISDIDYNNNNDGCPSKEAYYYKNKFIEYFGKDRLNIIPHYWQPDFINNNVYVDPSARVLNVY